MRPTWRPATARPLRCCGWCPRGDFALSPQQLVLEPAPHGGAAEREVIALAMLGAAFLAREHAQRLVLRSAGVVERLRVGERDLLVVGAVHNQERAAHLLHHAV